MLALIYTIGEISGAHLNPAVTVAFAARGHFPWRRVPGYFLAQVAGAVLAAGLLRFLFGDAGGLGGTAPGRGIGAGTALVMEIVLTFGLVTVILGTASGAAMWAITRRSRSAATSPWRGCGPARSAACP